MNPYSVAAQFCEVPLTINSYLTLGVAEDTQYLTDGVEHITR